MQQELQEPQELQLLQELQPHPQPQRLQQRLQQPQVLLLVLVSDVPPTLPLLLLQLQFLSLESVTPETVPEFRQQGLQQEFATKPGNVMPPQILHAIRPYLQKRCRGEILHDIL